MGSLLHLLLFLSLTFSTHSALSPFILFNDITTLLTSEWKNNAEQECPRILAQVNSGIQNGGVDFMNQLYDCQPRQAVGYYTEEESFFGRFGSFLRALLELAVGRI